MEVNSVWSEKAYRKVNSDEGAYMALVGYNAIAEVTDSDGNYRYYLYTGPGDDEGGWTFSDYEECERFCDRVLHAGRINEAEYWVWVGYAQGNILPDYVENPFRPEYN